MVEIEGVEAVYERLFVANDTKDVEIAMADGSLWAHSVILSANSEAIDGMLKHGVASTEKKLHWKDYPISTGKFVLRLMYTGTVDPDDWASANTKSGSSRAEEEKKEEVPLECLLGGAAITKTYMIPHLLATFVKALQSRLCAKTFNTICKCAVNSDITALRVSCVKLARGNDNSVIVSQCGMAEFNGTYMPDGKKNGKTKYKMNGHDVNTINFSKDIWFLCKSYAKSWYSFESDADVPPEGVWKIGELGCSPAPVIRKSCSVRELYDEQKLDPEVMSELAGIFGAINKVKKKRKTI